MTSSNQGINFSNPCPVTKYSYNNSESRDPIEWNVLGYKTQEKDDVAKAKSILLLSTNVTAAEQLNSALSGLGFVSRSLTSKHKVFKDQSAVELDAKALSDKIERFRAELFRDYLDLVSDPEFLVSAIQLGDRVSISNKNLNTDSEQLNSKTNDEEAAVALAAQLHPIPGKHHVLLKPLKNPPTLAGKIFAATQLSILGMHHTGISAQAILMWPKTEFNEHDVKLVAAKILTSVQTALLLKLSPEQIDQIWTDQDEYLSFVSGPELPDDNHPTE
jgi:hypothetical protein